MMDRPHRAWPIEHRCVCMCLQGALANNQIYIYACTSLHVCVCMRGHVSDYVQVCESVCVCLTSGRVPGQKGHRETKARSSSSSCRAKRHPQRPLALPSPFLFNGSVPWSYFC